MRRDQSCAREGQNVYRKLGFIAVYVAAVRVKPFVSRWLRFAHVLFKGAFQAISQVDYVPASAVQTMSYLELFLSVVTGEGLARSELAATFVLQGAQTRGATR